MTLTREKALELLHYYVKNEKMIFHCLASEAVLKGIARKLGQDEEKWAMAGLLHDLDVEVTHADPLVHGTQTARLLKDYNVDPEILDAISMHNECSAGKERNTEFQHALAAGETITGLIFATTYVYPDRKLSSVKPKSVVKRMKEKIFAASVKRENILECEKVGIPIDEFAALAINSMLPIAGELGL
ncbi:MAG: HDIG domain-containing protein [Bacteroidales bacterium]|nr:HDIG domain-containing protein [Bacteroidales bacterium]HNW74983.1 HDIG domain-containing protein [Bacteroidales bacterium]HPS49194.1 HDIG domain-containing protein [Bacteroidales bacterium]